MPKCAPPGVRGILIYCSDYKCSHSTAIAVTAGLLMLGCQILRAGIGLRAIACVATKIEIGDFLGRGKAGPEHQALVRLIGDLVDTDSAGGFDRWGLSDLGYIVDLTR